MHIQLRSLRYYIPLKSHVKCFIGLVIPTGEKIEAVQFHAYPNQTNASCNEVNQQE